MTTFNIHSIGSVKQDGGKTAIHIDAAYKDALKGLGDFSHVYVLFWADRYADKAHRATHVVPLPYAEGVETGVFANRSPVRPNPILISLCAIESVDENAGTVTVNAIDAFDGSPVLDLKPYYPVTDRVKEAQIPPYLMGWPVWFPEEGIGLMPHES
ncbi:MAG: tRNA (N6-threonylcarbamoyladenosine(37)-N6)-methyltransferase TrmO [Anaerolineae bacterium]|jgi:tRNA-Thr(GGU) m(6)t(6)A37 methyltransferase TsaA|nr:tRNA (N6-threonylcarbamoyladenosine(37)-N6)-methyltransferase TrmO [Anaerolineae bacterium]